MARVTQQIFADFVGLDKSTVSKMVKEGNLSLADGLEAGVKQYCARLREQAAGRAPVESGNSDFESYDLVAERARLAHHQANKTELEAQVLKRSLIPAEEVRDMMQLLVSNSRAKLLTLPVKAAQIAIAGTDLKEIERGITELVHESLMELSSESSGSNGAGLANMGTAAALNS